MLMCPRLDARVGIARIAGYEQRPRFQVVDEVPEPDSAQADQKSKIGPIDFQGVLAEGRHYDPENVDDADHDHPDRDDAEQAGIALDEAHQQEEERNAEVENRDGPGHIAPAPAEATDVPGDFIRKIFGPDDDELR